ncbi:MAG: dihydropteroate synthase [Pseudomonadota bacterium]
MGILNITPDSFSDGGLFVDSGAALQHVDKMVKAGADIIDIGGESTRPYALPVSVDEELSRVCPLIEAVRKRWDVWVSVDTYKAEVAREAVRLGAEIINDITALRQDPAMLDVLRSYDTPVILMHMQGLPRTMQVNPHYDDVVSEIVAFFRERIKWCKERGIREENLIIDPGIGFGKDLQHNLALLRAIDDFRSLGRPVLIGASRKSFLGKILPLNDNEKDMATQAVSAVAVWQGASIIRVHDVRSAVCTVRIVEAIKNGRGLTAEHAENVEKSVLSSL